MITASNGYLARPYSQNSEVVWVLRAWVKVTARPTAVDSQPPRFLPDLSDNQCQQMLMGRDDT